MTDDDKKLDQLLGTIKEPVPEEIIEKAWDGIEPRLQQEKPMFTTTARIRSIIFSTRLSTIAAALMVAFIVSLGITVKFGDQVRNLFVVSTDQLAGGTESRELKNKSYYSDNDKTIEDLDDGGMGTGPSQSLSGIGGELAQIKEKIRNTTVQHEFDEVEKSVVPETETQPAAVTIAPEFKVEPEEKDKPKITRIPPPETSKHPVDWDKLPERKPPTTAPVKPMQKVIKTATLDLEVKKFADASRAVAQIVTQYKGYYADSQINRKDNGTSGGSIVIRVPQHHFEACYAALRKLGFIKAENTKGVDVSDKYTDLEARITNARHLEKRLLAMLEDRRRQKMAEILEVEREIGRVRISIEKMQGKLRLMDDQIGYGTIHLKINEPKRSVPIGRFEIEVKSTASADKQIDRIVEQLGGQIQSRDTSKRKDGSSAISVVICVPIPEFGKLVESLNSLGRIDSREVNGYNALAVEKDSGAKDVAASVKLLLFESTGPIPSGMAKIEVASLESAATAIAALLNNVDGKVSSRQENRSQGSASATYTLRVPRGKYAQAVNLLAAVGRIDNKQFSGVAVTGVEKHASETPCTMSLLLFERKRQVPSADAAVVTPSLDTMAKNLSALLKEIGGQVASHVESRRPDGGSNASYAIRARQADFKQLINGLGTVGKVESLNVQGMDLQTVEGAAADVLCTLTMTVNEKKAPVPSANIEMTVDDAEEAAAQVLRLRDSYGAETARSHTAQQPDGSINQIWQLKVQVAKFDAIVEEIEGIGKIRTRNIGGIGAGLEEKPDPEAMADVLVTISQLSPLASPDDQSAASISGAVRLSGILLYKSLSLILFALLVVLPWAAVAILCRKTFRWARNR